MTKWELVKLNSIFKNSHWHLVEKIELVDGGDICVGSKTKTIARTAKIIYIPNILFAYTDFNLRISTIFIGAWH